MKPHGVGRPSIRRCRDHSGGPSQSRMTPIPRGKRPSVAALTRSGARNASEIDMFTCRTLHCSRVAIVSASVTAPEIIWSSQRRPRAIDATSLARVSARIGRLPCGPVELGTMISHRRFDGVFCHGMRRVRSGCGWSASSVPFASSCAGPCVLTVTANCSIRTSIRTRQE
jgi:hypothetical protein